MYFVVGEEYDSLSSQIQIASKELSCSTNELCEICYSKILNGGVAELNFVSVKPKGIPHSYHLDESISVLRVDGLYFSIFIQILTEHSARQQ